MELHSVIAELTRKLQRRRAATIEEEEEEAAGSDGASVGPGSESEPDAEGPAEQPLRYSAPSRALEEPAASAQPAGQHAAPGE